MSLLAHLRKELRLLSRDRHALIIGLLLPAIILVLFDQLNLGAWVQVEGRNPEAFILVIATVFPALLLASTSLLRERHQGTLARVLRSPTDPSTLVLAKSLAALLLIGLQVAVLIGAGRVTLSPSATHAPGGLALILLVAGASSYALGAWISSMARTEAQALQLTSMVFLVMLTMAGFLKPLATIGQLGELAGYAPMALAYDGARLLFAGEPSPSHVLILAASYLAFTTLAQLTLRVRRTN